MLAASSMRLSPHGSTDSAILIGRGFAWALQCRADWRRGGLSSSRIVTVTLRFTICGYLRLEYQLSPERSCGVEVSEIVSAGSAAASSTIGISMYPVV